MATFNCGHEGLLPQNMGRGAARERRIANHFDRKCLACRLESEARFEAGLTRPRTQEQHDLAIKRIKLSYE